jgi:hypothetical protein
VSGSPVYLPATPHATTPNRGAQRRVVAQPIHSSCETSLYFVSHFTVDTHHTSLYTSATSSNSSIGASALDSTEPPRPPSPWHPSRSRRRSSTRFGRQTTARASRCCSSSLIRCVNLTLSAQPSSYWCRVTRCGRSSLTRFCRGARRMMRSPSSSRCVDSAMIVVLG